MSRRTKKMYYGNVDTIYLELKELYLTTFEWVNMPKEIDRRYVEKRLYSEGSVIFFKDDLLGYLCLPYHNVGTLNLYGNPVRVKPYANNGWSSKKVYTVDVDCVIIWAGYMRMSPMLRMKDFAQRLWNIERTFDINIHAQKTPILLEGSKDQELTLKKLYQQYDDFDPVIIRRDTKTGKAVDVIITGAPFVADKLQDSYKKVWNDVLSYIGIESNFAEKKERLTPDEALLSNGLAIAKRNSRLQPREEAVEKINEMFSKDENWLEMSIEISNEALQDMGGGAEL